MANSGLGDLDRCLLRAVQKGVRKAEPNKESVDTQPSFNRNPLCSTQSQIQNILRKSNSATSKT